MAEMLVYLGVSSIIKNVVFYLWRDRLPRDAVLAGHVTKLNIYPLKSTREIDVQHMTCTADKGPFCDKIIDRQFFIYSSPKNDLLSIRMHPKLILVQPQFDGKTLTLTAPEHGEVTVDIKEVVRKKTKVEGSIHGSNVMGLDCGDDVSKWLSNYLGLDGSRLMYSDPAMPRRNFQFIFSNEGYGRWTKHANPEDKIFYQDAAPFHILSEQSTKALGDRLGSNISPMQFRPSILVDANNGPHDEDTWKEIFIGKTRFRTVLLCDRCVLPTIDRTSGVRNSHNEPLKTLKSYRCIVPGLSPMFGTHVVVERDGTIHVGDPIYVIRGYDANAVR